MSLWDHSIGSSVERRIDTLCEEQACKTTLAIEALRTILRIQAETAFERLSTVDFRHNRRQLRNMVSRAVRLKLLRIIEQYGVAEAEDPDLPSDAELEAFDQQMRAQGLGESA